MLPQRFTRHLVALALPALIACGQRGTTDVAATQFTLEQAADSIPLHYRTEVKVGDVWMSLTDVPSDSRCPRDVVCVWAGDAVAAIVVNPGCYKAGCLAPSMLLSLHTNLEPKTGEALGHVVTLLSLQPWPVADAPTPPKRYVAWVRVTQ